MTTTLTLALSAVKVGSGNPSTAFGQQASMPLEDEAYILSRAALPPEIPDTTDVTSAAIVWTQKEVISGSHNMKSQRHSAKFSSKSTWNSKPAVTGTIVTVTKSSPAAGTLWSLDVTSDVQGWFADPSTNFGWRIFSTSTTRHYFAGATAATGKPVLVIVYEDTPDIPSNLSPSGAAVSVSKPWLSFTTVPGMTKLQVQLDSAGGTTPTFDSGEVSATTGRLDLSTTAIAAIADGTSPSWRAQVRTPAGLSGYSDWVTFPRDVKGTVTFVTPATGVITDGTPPIELGFTGTATAYRIDFVDATGRLLSSSGATPGSLLQWTPTKGLTSDGATGQLRAFVNDDVVRVATTGDPIEATATLDVTLTLSGTDALDTLQTVQYGKHPAVHLQGTRALGAPDEVAVFRNDVQIARLVGLDVFDGTLFEWVDYTAPPSRLAEYRVAPITGGVISAAGPTRSIVPTCSGLWLIDPDTGTSAVLWDVEGDAPDGGDLAVVHQPATGDAPAVRRRLSRPPVSGVGSGLVMDVDGDDYLADDTLAALAAFSDLDQGHVLRYVVGHLNLPVIAGDFAMWPTPQSSKSDRFATASYSWWNQDAAATRVE